MSNNRNLGIDLLKIISCFGVVILHLIGRDSSEFTRILYYTVGFAVPSFFVAHGFFILNRKNNTLKYFVTKIFRMIAIAFVWNCIYDLVRFLTGHSLYNPFVETASEIFWQKGTFYQFWFFGSLIILYLLTPFLSKQVQKKNYYLLGMLAIICVIIDLISITNVFVVGKTVQEYVRQPLRLWTWILYYYMGGILRNTDINKKTVYQAEYMLVPVVILNVCYEYLVGYQKCGIDLAEFFYDNLLMIAEVMLVFIVLSNIQLTSTHLIKAVSDLSPLTMGVYILHLFCYRLIQPFYKFDNSFFNIGLCIVITIICLFVTAVIRRIPYVKQLVEL